MTHNIVVPSGRNFYAPTLKAIELNGVDTTGFLKNFVVLMYLFICIDILKSY